MNKDVFAVYRMTKGCAGNHEDFALFVFSVKWFLSIDVKVNCQEVATGFIKFCVC